MLSIIFVYNVILILRREYRGVPFDPTAALGHSGANITPQNHGPSSIQRLIDWMIYGFTEKIID